MKLDIKGNIATVDSDGVVIGSLDDGIDLIGECFGTGVNTLLIPAGNLAPEFFDLSTRLAGEVLQKFTQYHIKVGIIGDFADVESRSLRDFIRESNRAGQTVFAATPGEALALMK